MRIYGDNTVFKSEMVTFASFHIMCPLGQNMYSQLRKLCVTNNNKHLFLALANTQHTHLCMSTWSYVWH